MKRLRLGIVVGSLGFLCLCAAVGRSDPARKVSENATASLEAGESLEWFEAEGGEFEGPRHDLPHHAAEPEADPVGRTVYDFEDDGVESELLAPEGASLRSSSRAERSARPAAEPPRSRAKARRSGGSKRSGSGIPAGRKDTIKLGDGDGPIGSGSSARMRARASKSKPLKKDSDLGYDRRIQSGSLTAGAFDDSLNPDVFRAFLDHVWSHRELSRVAVAFEGPSTTITVVDARGRPVGDARVSVRSGRRAPTTLRTGTDGRAVYMHAWDGPAPNGLDVEVTADGKRASAQLDDRGGDRLIRVQGAKGELPRALDVALVIDATGSMSDELEYLKVEISAIAERIHRNHPGVDQRFALVVYRDAGDEFVTRVRDFRTIDEFRAALGAQSAAGGGDYPESMHLALSATNQLKWRKGNVARVAFLVADAPPHPGDYSATISAADDLRRRGVSIYPVAASGVAHEAELIMRTAAYFSGGQYVFLTDDSGIGNPHAEPHIPCYVVESLSRTMSRMLEGELAGRRVEADQRSVIREVGRSRNGVCVRGRR